MSETPGVTKNEGIQKLLEAEKEATKIVDEARQRKYLSKEWCVQFWVHGTILIFR